MRVHDGDKRWCAGVPMGASDPWANRGYKRAAVDSGNELPSGISAVELEARRLIVP